MNTHFSRQQPCFFSLLPLSFSTIMVTPDGHDSRKLYFLAVLLNVLIPVTKYGARSEEKSGTVLLGLCLKGTSPSWRGWHGNTWLHGERNLLQLLRADKGAETEDTVGPHSRTRNQHEGLPSAVAQIIQPGPTRQRFHSCPKQPPQPGAKSSNNGRLFTSHLNNTLSLWPPTHFCKSVLSYQELQPGNGWSRQSCFPRTGRADASGSFSCSAFSGVSEVNASFLLLSRANALINFNHAKFTFSNRLKSSQKLEPRAICCLQSLSDTSLSVLCDNPLGPVAVLWGVDHSHCRLPNEEISAPRAQQLLWGHRVSV